MNLLGAVFLIAGTCIGGGMLALPVDTGIAGFFPSLLGLVLSWLFMTATALLLLEASLWMEEGTHVMTIASRLLGRFGKGLSLFLFLFMGYLSLIAYTTGGAQILVALSQVIGGVTLSHLLSLFLFVGFFGLIILFGTNSVGRINTILVAGMIFAYLGLVSFGFFDIHLSYLYHSNMNHLFKAFPILLTIFSFQMIIPSLVPYLNRDVKKLKTAIIVGTTVAFVIYLLWQWVILGTIPPSNDGSVTRSQLEGQIVTGSFRKAASHPFLAYCADFFSFFAISTSFLGIGLSLYDFLADALKQPKKGLGKVILITLVLGPSLLFAVIYPQSFLTLLEVTGGFGDAILNGLLPVCMVFAGRYIKGYESIISIKGGRFTLAVLAAYAIFVIGTQVQNLIY
jgi:tyrosine-specific transport protein